MNNPRRINIPEEAWSPQGWIVALLQVLRSHLPIDLLEHCKRASGEPPLQFRSVLVNAPILVIFLTEWDHIGRHPRPLMGHHGEHNWELKPACVELESVGPLVVNPVPREADSWLIVIESVEPV